MLSIVTGRRVLKYNQITNFLSCQSNKPVSVSEDLKVAVAQWIASAVHVTVIVEEDGLLIIHVALQNQTYNLSKSPYNRLCD